MIRIILKSERVEFILARKNCTKMEFAKKIGISAEYFYQMLSGHRCPSADMRDKIMTALRIKDRKWDDIFQVRNSEHL